MTTKKLQNNPVEVKLQLLEEEIQKIKERNTEKDEHKAWETSLFRKFLIAILTYFVMVLLMGSIGVEEPEVNAIVPTFGFLLSTFSLSVFKSLWNKAQK
jgi:hypothetical protein